MKLPDTPLTAGGPGGRDRMLAVKSRKNGQIGAKIISHTGVGQKQKTEKKEKRLNDGNNNGQGTRGTRKHAWCMQAACDIVTVWQ